MLEKTKNMLILVLLGGFVCVLSLTCILKKPQAISYSERRKLAQFPQMNIENMQSGKFTQEFERYASDQFPLRDTFLQLNVYYTKDILQKKDINQLYIRLKDVIAMEYPLHKASLQHAAKLWKSIQQTYLAEANHVYYSIIPDKSYFLSDEEYLKLDYAAFFEEMHRQVGDMTYIDILPYLQLTDYYRSDPHWRQEKIIDVAQVLGEHMGVSIASDYTIEKVDAPFYGSYYARSFGMLKAEDMYYVTNDAMQQYRVYDYQNQREIPIYDPTKAKGKDPYEFYLSGPLSYLTIENPTVQNGRELVIFRDSFASSIAPLLASGYQKISLLDIRYLPSSMLGSYVDFSGKDVLFLYSTSVLNHSETLK